MRTTETARQVVRAAFLAILACLLVVTELTVTTHLIASEPASAAANGSTPRQAVTTDRVWDSLFARTNGWTGGDVSGSVDLRDGRTLWLFGDSWIGPVVNGRHPPGTPMVNNAVAIQSPADGHSASGGAMRLSAADSRIDFYWRSGTKNPKAWLAPAQPIAPDQAGRARLGERGTWFWPTGGGIIVPGPGGKPRLLLFFLREGKQPNRVSTWAFRTLGSTMAIVDNVAEPIARWTPRQFDIPFAISADETNSTRDEKPRRRVTTWGMAVCRPNRGDGTLSDWLYVFGVRNESALDRQLLLARVRVASPADFGGWEFFAGGGKWSHAPGDAATLARGVANEFSIERLPAGQTTRRPIWLMVYSEPPLGRRIFIRTAAVLEGPWSERKVVYSVPDVARDPDYFAYAAKGHVALSRPGELLVSYVVSAHDFGKMARDASIYRPRFVHVPIAEVLGDDKRQTTTD